jgi:hypothetical protein
MDTSLNAAAPSLAPSALKVQGAAGRLGLAVMIRQMPGSTRTAEEAAAACGCDVGQIVKSLVFAGAASGRPYLLLGLGQEPRHRDDGRGRDRRAFDATRCPSGPRLDRLRHRRHPALRTRDGAADLCRRGSAGL